MSWLFGEPPERGRFVALYDDGSGAALFVWGDDGHLFDAEGDGFWGNNDYGAGYALAIRRDARTWHALCRAA